MHMSLPDRLKAALADPLGLLFVALVFGLAIQL
jgi:hypothetical protein